MYGCFHKNIEYSFFQYGWEMFLEQQLTMLELFLKYHVTEDWSDVA